MPILDQPKNYAETRAEKTDWLSAVAAERGAGCRDWPWPAATPNGYGQVWMDGRMRLVGHVILRLSGRERPTPQHHQLHSCDRPSCAAPWHLRWGLNEENVADKVARGRTAGQPGEENNNARLTAEDVKAIRASAEPLQVIARNFGVARSTVSMIRLGRRWPHV